MKTATRIPAIPNGSFFSMNHWFLKMYEADLLYHPDEDAENIVNVTTGEPTFTPEECARLNASIDLMFQKQGEKVYDVCMDYYQKALNITAQ